MPHVLIIDDASDMAGIMQVFLQSTGYETAVARDADSGLKLFQREAFDAVIADMKMKPKGGVAFLKLLQERNPDVVLILMADAPSLEGALEAVRAGAFDYLQKPIRPTDLSQALKRAMEREKRRKQQEKLAASGVAAAGAPVDVLRKIIPGESGPVQQVQRLVERLLPGRNPVVIQGEEGTGKNALCSYFHSHGPSKDGPYVVIDLAGKEELAIRTGLIGDQLRMASWVEQAKGGTLVLHGIETLSMKLQQEFKNIFAGISTHLRLVCTSSLDLEEEIAEGRYSEDLFLRLCNLPINLPPLRDVPEDVPVLVGQFTRETLNPSIDSARVVFSDEAMGIFKKYDWPGNMLELKQVVAGLVATTESRFIGKALLPAYILNAVDQPDLKTYLVRQQAAYLTHVVRSSGGDVPKAAKALGLDTKALEGLREGVANVFDLFKTVEPESTRILLVQPDETQRWALRETLKDFGVEAVPAAHGLEALLMVHGGAKFGAAIVEEDLPVLDALIGGPRRTQVE